MSGIKKLSSFLKYLSKNTVSAPWYKENDEVYLKNNKLINESKILSTKERNKLDDSEFGIQELRKYPLHDKKHVYLAIKMFNHVEEEYEQELAIAIKKKMKEYKISKDIVTEKNRLYKYL